MPRPTKQERRRRKRREVQREKRIARDLERRESRKAERLLLRDADVDWLRERMDGEIRAGDWHAAARTGADLVNLEPGIPELWHPYLFALYKSVDSLYTVIPEARKAIASCPDDADLRSVLIRLLNETGDRAGAELEMDEGMERFGTDMWSSLTAMGVNPKRGDFLGWKKTLLGLKRMRPRREPPLARSMPDTTPPRSSNRTPPSTSAGRSAPGPRALPASSRAGIPLPEAHAISTPLTITGNIDAGLADALAQGRDDGIDTVLLAARAMDIMTEDGFDRLMALDRMRGVEMLGYQVETAMKVLRGFKGRVLLSDEVGLGKTIEACMVLCEYLARGLVDRCLILVPPSLVLQWKAELAEKFSIEAATTQDPELRQDPRSFWSGGKVIVASLATARARKHADLILQQRFDMLIVDEAHRIKNRSTLGWKLVNSIRSRFFLMLTATPVETDLAELYNLVTVLRPGTLGTEAEFRSRFVRRDDPARPRDPDRLRHLLAQVMIRNTRATCGVMLPPRTAQTVTVRPSDAERDMYRRIVSMSRRATGRTRNLVRLLMEEAGSSPAAVASTASRAIASGSGEPLGGELHDLAREASRIQSTAKLDTLMDAISGDPVLVFSRFRATIDMIASALTRRSIRFAQFHGSMNAQDRDRAVEAFAQGRARVLLCSAVGGEGRNLQFCHRLINYDLPWNPMEIEQRIGRIHRIGQTEQVHVLNLAGTDTAEERILKVLDERVNMFELVVGEMDMLLGEMTDDEEFAERVFGIYASSRDDSDVETGFEELASELERSRARLDRAHALDEELFGEEYGT